MPTISKELQDTIRSLKAINTVYFDAQGNHYFNVYELAASKTNPATAKYGRGIFSHKSVMPGIHNVDKQTEDIAVGDPNTMIVETLTRAEVLAVKVVPKGNLLLDMLANASDEEKAMIKALLGTPTVDNTPDDGKGKKK